MAEKARREGLLALEDDLEIVEPLFLRDSIQFVVDGTDWITDPRNSEMVADGFQGENSVVRVRSR